MGTKAFDPKVMGSTNTNVPAYSDATDTWAKRKLNDIPVFILDGPATSLIEEMILYSNGIEIERL